MKEVKHKNFPLVKLSLSLVVLSMLSGSAMTQIRTNWFDINPSQSNTDASSPNGSSGGRVQHLASTSDMRRMFAATEWGGLYTSFNSGVSWVKVNTFVPSATWDVKVEPNNDRIRVYATSLYNARVSTPAAGGTGNFSGISISDDGGNTWRNAPLPTLNCATPSDRNEPSAFQIAINARHPNMVFVGTNCGLARTFNNGGNWDYVDPTPGNNAERIFAVISHGDSIVDVIGSNGHFRSNNAGNTWTAVNNLAGGFGPGASIAVSPAENNVLFAAVSGNIFESDNGGTSWPTSITIPAGNAQGRIPFIKTNQRATSNQFDVWYGDVSLFKTTGTTPPPGTGGSRVPANPTWTNQQQGAHNDVADILFDPRAQADACPILFSNDGGVYRNLGVNAPGCQTPLWEQPGVTPHATWIFGFEGTQQFPGVQGIYYGLQDNGSFGTVSAIEGPSAPTPAWNNNGCCDAFADAAQSNMIVYNDGLWSPGRGIRMFKKGANFSGGGEVPNYPSNGTFAGFKSGREIVRLGNNSFAVALSDGVYMTNNIDANPIAWTSLSAPGGSTAGNNGHLKVSRVGSPTSIYFHTGSGNPTGQGQIFRRGLNRGDPWLPLTLPNGVGAVTVYDVDPNNGNRLIICGINNGAVPGTIFNNFSMWRTDNFGGSWTPLGNLDNLMTGGGAFVNRTVNGPTNFTGLSSYWQPFLVQFNPNNGNTIVAGAADAGVFLTTDFGGSWRLISNPNNPNSTTPHIPRPLFAHFSPTRFTATSMAFDVWIGSQGAGVTKVLVESP